MIRPLPFIICLFLTFLVSAISSQVALPYYSGFDNTAERAGWQIYRTAEHALANWSIAPAQGFSPSSCISHDYAPSTGSTLADDWFVSPGFLLPAGGTLDSVRYAFSGFSVPADQDTIGVYLLTGSQDPEAATSITLLKDFRGNDYPTDGVYRLLSGIALPATQETAYIAIRYRNSHVSSWWLTVRFDNIAVSESPNAVKPSSTAIGKAAFPNPCNDVLHIPYTANATSIALHDYLGRQVSVECALRDDSPVLLKTDHLPAGIYLLSIAQEGQLTSQLIVKQY